MTMFRSTRSRVFARRRGTSSRRHRYEWQGVAVTLTTVAVGEITNFPLSAIAAELSDLTNPTIKRIRGNLHLHVNATSGAYWSAGIILIEANALIAGAFPQPNADFGADWMWINGGYLEDFGSGQRYLNLEVDVRAQRRFDADNYAPQLLVSNSGSSPGALLTQFTGRILYEQV